MLTKVAERLHATPSQVALAWTLRRAKVVLPIPGTANPEHLQQNIAAAALRISDDEFRELDRQGRQAA